MSRLNIMLIFGTRPEVIKMAPILHELHKFPEHFRTIVAVTAQHREMMDQMLDIFNISADYDLDIMSQNQKLSDITCGILKGLEPIIEKKKLDYVLVQGDTTTSWAASLISFYHKIKIGHVEAGLRTYQKFNPFPEEINRTLISSLADIHFAPTLKAKENLIKQGFPEDMIIVTGNTVIDALLRTVGQETTPRKAALPFKTILVTAHRRENFGAPFVDICLAVLDILKKNKEVRVVFPVHLNPNVRKTVNKYLANHERIELIEPLDYLSFTRYLADSYLVLTDSGGIQEEAPSLGKPLLVLRNETERTEGIDAGTCLLVGTDRKRIVTETCNLLNNQGKYDEMARAVNPYGDGKASQRIVEYFLNRYFPN